MGTDKAMFEIEGISMICRVAGALAGAGLEPIRIAVARPGDVEKYGSVLDSDLEVEWVLDGKTHAGPIDALEEALMDPRLEEQSTLQLAPVDCPWITAGLFSSLREGLAEGDGLIMPHDGERTHPLLALIRPKLVRKMIVGDRRPLHVQFSQTRHSVLQEDPEVLRNVNSPEDLEGNPT
ncbi:MAG: hypothetical protein CMA88_01420 [Euryarchaeota archaeon]|nr:hypothetical protein [Euryarchaeota archaeon]|tara:strand:+ start:1565 stop:2101 length:537 start_codon:yes stop_codon:yes gene_type:complete